MPLCRACFVPLSLPDTSTWYRYAIPIPYPKVVNGLPQYDNTILIQTHTANTLMPPKPNTRKPTNSKAVNDFKLQQNHNTLMPQFLESPMLQRPQPRWKILHAALWKIPHAIRNVCHKVVNALRNIPMPLGKTFPLLGLSYDNTSTWWKTIRKIKRKILMEHYHGRFSCGHTHAVIRKKRTCIRLCTYTE